METGAQGGLFCFPGLDTRVNRATAAATYVPVPGLAWLVARAAPDDRFVRYHARQGGWLTGSAYLVLLGLGFGMLAPGLDAALGPVAGAVGGVALAGLAFGAVGAGLGRYVRVRPVWDILAFAALHGTTPPSRARTP